RCLAVLETDPGATVVATGISLVDERGNAIRYPRHEAACSFYEEIGDLALALVNGNCLITTSNIVASRAVFDEVGVFDDLRYTHDLDFLLRLWVHGRRLALLRRSLLTYRVHAGNTIAEAPSRARFETAVVAASFALRFEAGKAASGNR